MSFVELFPYPGHRLGEIDRALASNVKDWAEKEVISGRLELKEDYERLLQPALGKLLLDIGLQKMFWPESTGGDGYNEPRASYTVAATLEQVGKADTGIAFLAAHGIALQAALALDGNKNDEVLRSVGSMFCDGRGPVIVSFVLPTYAEDGGLPEWRGRYFQVEAHRGAEGWVLEGRGARPTCSGADADLFGFLCTVDGDEEPAFILVPGGAPGLRRGPERKETGLAASRNADLDLEGVEVPVKMCAWRGEEGTRRLLSWYYLGLGASAVGALLSAFEIISEWGSTRVIKGCGCIFKENPLTASVMAEIAGQVGVCRLLVYDLAEILARPGEYEDAGTEAVFIAASTIVHQVYRTAEECINRVMELMNSAGYAREWQLERYWRDLKTVCCYMGAGELAKMDVARWFYDCRTL